ncbi:hypothetical protein CXG81DRAFT_17227 [Caulochytrium protostelioides]|uniref:WW domain-containing protein n=1 Tax=Caulochytrium protostelioides TaxID=1555241 RepID=A0A4P9XCL4_9FUNG|nr:hypothetical protein CXG81DRAFT_17227 [Caulochytrium protostelioides]|eukprot:RKP03162.1 hypothetical protein CXG81DRAFT_17227 [Caulochytrium protostelioides]
MRSSTWLCHAVMLAAAAASHGAMAAPVVPSAVAPYSPVPGPIPALFPAGMALPVAAVSTISPGMPPADPTGTWLFSTPEENPFHLDEDGTGLAAYYDNAENPVWKQQFMVIPDHHQHQDSTVIDDGSNRNWSRKPSLNGNRVDEQEGSRPDGQATEDPPIDPGGGHVDPASVDRVQATLEADTSSPASTDGTSVVSVPV